MIVYIPSPLRSYTKNQSQVQSNATTVDALSKSLDKDFPGIRFRIIDEQDRIREHIKIFVNGEEINALDAPLKDSDVVHIMCALSGG